MGTRIITRAAFIFVCWVCCGLVVSCTGGKKDAPEETKQSLPVETPDKAPSTENVGAQKPQPAAANTATQPATSEEQAVPSRDQTAADQTISSTAMINPRKLPGLTPEDLADPRLQNLPLRTRYVLKTLEKVQQRMPPSPAHADTTPAASPYKGTPR